MSEMVVADLCIIGAGAGGLSVAAGATQLGLTTVLIEGGEMGGDCLNAGCVPSKALLAVAKRAHLRFRSLLSGVPAGEVSVDFAGVRQHVRATIEALAHHDSQERFEALGAKVIRAHARFLDERTVQAGGVTVRARHFVVATGSRALVPPIPGIGAGPVLTNETIFQLDTAPGHLIIIGGGPIGVEMAQAHRRLGCSVTIIEQATLLARDDASNVRFVRDALIADGIALLEGAAIREVRHADRSVSVVVERGGTQEVVSGTHLFVAAGRAPNTAGLDLEKAGISYGRKGIDVDRGLRTSNRRVFAIGDVAGGPQFTHIAGYHASIVIRRICFKMFWAKVDYSALPWVTYTDPELAQVGMTEVEARKRHGDGVHVVEWSFGQNDRAVAERTTVGQARVITDGKGRILGASMVGPHAGELIGVWALAITSRLRISAMASTIFPYPTLGEINKRVAGSWFTGRLFSEKTKALVGLLKHLGPRAA